MKIIQSQDVETGNISVSFFRNKPPKKAALKLFEFKSEDGKLVEIFAEENDTAMRREIVNFIRQQFGVNHPDPKTAEWLTKNFSKKSEGIGTPFIAWLIEFAGLMMSWTILCLFLFLPPLLGIWLILYFTGIEITTVIKITWFVVIILYFLAMHKTKLGKKYQSFIGRITGI